ncbi:hypothetical protein [Conexibacter woesei]|uniref:hypothetical protein n=1 Tax=Conexibacter woesei TaxID=191495 RepID=UPI0004246609|nr:hypothetical protein [Conexibacter woesei]
MAKLTRMVVLACALIALAAAPTSASAAPDWHSGNAGAYVLTATTAVFIDINAGAVRIACTGMIFSGNVNPSPAAGTNPWVGFASATPGFTGCRTAGVPTTIACAAASFDTGVGPGAYAGPIVAPADGGVTSMAITGISCTISLAGRACSTFTGMTPGLHTNPSNLARTDGSVSFPGNPGQVLVAAKVGAGCAPIPNGAVFLLNPGGAGMLLKYTFPAGGPAAQPYVWYG